MLTIEAPTQAPTRVNILFQQHLLQCLSLHSCRASCEAPPKCTGPQQQRGSSVRGQGLQLAGAKGHPAQQAGVALAACRGLGTCGSGSAQLKVLCVSSGQWPWPHPTVKACSSMTHASEVARDGASPFLS